MTKAKIPRFPPRLPQHSTLGQDVLPSMKQENFHICSSFNASRQQNHEFLISIKPWFRHQQGQCLLFTCLTTPPASSAKESPLFSTFEQNYSSSCFDFHSSVSASCCCRNTSEVQDMMWEPNGNVWGNWKNSVNQWAEWKVLLSSKIYKNAAEGGLFLQ